MNEYSLAKVQQKYKIRVTHAVTRIFLCADFCHS